ncbi:MAG: BLUF domain-containing protein [Pandoraea sp.]|nr:BLUF domain-containing protein [Pandoraea sp.]
MIECYAYLSRALPDLDLRELAKIIVNSRGLNATYGITGVLLYDGTPHTPGAFPTWSLGYLMLDQPAHALQALMIPADHADLVGAFAALAAKSDAM